MRNQHHTQHLFCRFLYTISRIDNLDAPALAPASCVYLRFYDPTIAAKIVSNA
jgi:hypothetical protein